MKRKRSFVLDEKDDKAVQLFSELGMPKNLAKTLMYISQVPECKSADVEQGADLRQPEVSIAMKELIQKGWIKKRQQKTKGKGRPFHVYSTVSELPELFSNFQQEKLREVEGYEQGLFELKNLISENKTK